MQDGLLFAGGVDCNFFHVLIMGYLGIQIALNFEAHE
jgi:hypothetical protein